MPSVKFQPRFAPLVQFGQKTQTIRPMRKRPLKVGDRLFLDTWEGKPYRSKTRRLGIGVIESVQLITLGRGPVHGEIIVDGQLLGNQERTAVARADGFSSVAELLDWFEENHGLPFCGVIIRWELRKAGG